MAVLVHRAGQERLAICVAGLTSLLASPISWSHHYVWIVPLVVVLLMDRELAVSVRVLGLFYGVWTLHAPFKQLPGGDGAELTYSLGHHVVDTLGVGMGLAFLALCGALAARRQGGSTALTPGVLI